MTLTNKKNKFLRSELGFTAPTQQLLQLWLQSKGAVSSEVNQAWSQYLDSLGVEKGALPDRWKIWLTGLGHWDGQLASSFEGFWSDVSGTPYVPPEPAPNTAPVAGNQSVSVDENGSLAITLTGSDSDGDSLSFAYNQPSNGTVTGTAPNVTYTPNADYFGSDSFTFTVSDGTDTTTGTINITVNEVADVPQTGTVYAPEFNGVNTYAELTNGWQPTGSNFTIKIKVWNDSGMATNAHYINTNVSGTTDFHVYRATTLIRAYSSSTGSLVNITDYADGYSEIIIDQDNAPNMTFGPAFFIGSRSNISRLFKGHWIGLELIDPSDSSNSIEIDFTRTAETAPSATDNALVNELNGQTVGQIYNLGSYVEAVTS